MINANRGKKTKKFRNLEQLPSYTSVSDGTRLKRQGRPSSA